MTIYQKFKKLKIDFSAIEFEQAGDDDKYFCTPIGARIIGRAGVDGIHYCFVRGQGDMDGVWRKAFDPFPHHPHS